MLLRKVRRCFIFVLAELMTCERVDGWVDPTGNSLPSILQAFPTFSRSSPGAADARDTAWASSASHVEPLDLVVKYMIAREHVMALVNSFASAFPDSGFLFIRSLLSCRCCGVDDVK